ncbi:Putative ribosomal protein L10P [Septoria linicola]|uniref:Ribosomal protein L10P n=1 Tax=Septoria linicola TaxID=215465 RepID=A0A9Q9EGL2_9PEZI|nr:putative ribosomal protein L10P [Septoria linicola]USW48378.1 Putative ribosomal protein L10P [Septoria linicola]
MPPRIRISARQLHATSIPSPTSYVCRQCRYASVAASATATTPAAPIEANIGNASAATVLRRPSKQPPSHKPPEFRKSQLHRQYQSLLRASPLMLIFQHNNLKSTEFMSIRRELAAALRKVDEELAKTGNSDFSGADVKLQVVQTGIFASALKVVEFWDPDFDSVDASEAPLAASSNALEPRRKPDEIHGLSRLAWKAGKETKKTHGLESLLSGPIAVVSIPAVSPQHLKAALSILAPNSDFPAPKRRTNPGYHEPAVQNGLQKLMLLGARIEGKAFDMEGARWVGGIQGGLEGLRGQLVAMLQGLGAGITSALSAASTNLSLTMESRKTMLEEEAKPKSEDEAK